MSANAENPFSAMRGCGPPRAVQERIVQNLMVKLARQRRRRQVAFGLLAAATAALLVAVLWRAHAPSPPDRAPRSVAAAAAWPRAGALWRTGTAQSRLQIGPHRVSLGTQSALVMRGRTDRSTELDLREGRATFEVARLAPHTRFRVHTAAVVVEVVGTRFTTEVEGPCTRVDVQSGVVRTAARATGLVELLRRGEARTFCQTPASRPAPALSAGDEQIRSALQLIVEGRELGRADALLARYIAEHPEGVLAEDALYHRILIRLRTSRCASAQTLLGTLVARFPAAERAGHVRRLLRERCPADASDQP